MPRYSTLHPPRVAARFLFALILICIDSILVLAQPDPITVIHAGEIRLGRLESSAHIHTYTLEPSEHFMKVSLAAYGHIYSLTPPVEPILRQPVIEVYRRLKSDPGAASEKVGEGFSPDLNIHIARVQNLKLDAAYQYEVNVGTGSGTGGRYALVADPAVPGFEFEVEDLDLGADPLGRPHVMTAAYSVADPSSPSGVRVYAGTGRGSILSSTDGGQTWDQVYPTPGVPALQGAVYELFVDSHGIIYASPWSPSETVQSRGIHGHVIESRDGGAAWRECLDFEWPTGVAWRITEDRHGNVFVGEYCGIIRGLDAPPYHGNLWRRKNHGDNGEAFEIVFSNPSDGADTLNNHVHFIGADPYSDAIYAAIGDGAVGRFLRSFQQGDPGTWETLERGVDAQYTSIEFTPYALFLGMDTNRMFKKIVKWTRDKNAVDGSEPFVTTSGIDNFSVPVPWADKGNWLWSNYFENRDTVTFTYLPYQSYPLDNGQMQSPRLYATHDGGETWHRVVTFPPNPFRGDAPFGENGPKFGSNIGPDGWVYAMTGTMDDQIHRGFRYRMVPKTSSADEVLLQLK
ncbi:MAG: hypothetical protein GC154_01510 [bacterium]|nr:hypothetical protein [bacterium]